MLFLCFVLLEGEVELDKGLFNILTNDLQGGPLLGIPCDEPFAEDVCKLGGAALAHGGAAACAAVGTADAREQLREQQRAGHGRDQHERARREKRLAHTHHARNGRAPRAGRLVVETRHARKKLQGSSSLSSSAIDCQESFLKAVIAGWRSLDRLIVRSSLDDCSVAKGIMHS